jgi:hypothetical protein
LGTSVGVGLIMLNHKSFYWLNMMLDIDYECTLTDTNKEMKDAVISMAACELWTAVREQCYKQGSIVGEYTDLSFFNLDLIRAAVDGVSDVINSLDTASHEILLITNPSGVTILQTGTKTTQYNQIKGAGDLIVLQRIGEFDEISVLCSAISPIDDIIIFDINKTTRSGVVNINSDCVITTDVTGDFSDVKIIKMSTR